MSNPKYANLWQRLLSGIVDNILIIPFLKLFIWFMDPMLDKFYYEPFTSFLISMDIELTENSFRTLFHFYSLLIGFLFYSTYFLITCLSKYQATLGMRLLKMKILLVNSQKVNWYTIIFRTFVMHFVHIVIIILFLYYFLPENISPEGFGIVVGISQLANLIIISAMILFTRKRQAYYDLVARTVIVKE